MYDSSRVSRKLFGIPHFPEILSFGSKFDKGATSFPFCATGTWVRVTKFSVTCSANVCFDGFWWPSPITCLLICLRPGVSGKFPSVSLRRLRRARVTAQIVVFAWWSLLENFSVPRTYSLTRLKAIGVRAAWREKTLALRKSGCYLGSYASRTASTKKADALSLPRTPQEQATKTDFRG